MLSEDGSSTQEQCHHKTLQIVVPANDDSGFIYRCVDCGLAFEFPFVKVLTSNYALAIAAALDPEERFKLVETVASLVAEEIGDEGLVEEE